MAATLEQAVWGRRPATWEMIFGKLASPSYASGSEGSTSHSKVCQARSLQDWEQVCKGIQRVRSLPYMPVNNTGGRAWEV